MMKVRIECFYIKVGVYSYSGRDFYKKVKYQTNLSLI